MRLECRRHFRNKKREFLKDKINELAMRMNEYNNPVTCATGCTHPI
jgi:hypothetical protein